MSDADIKTALDQFAESQDGSAYNRDAWYEDIKFARMSEQWPEDVAELRKREARPCLTVNKLDPLIRQVVNEARQNKPGIKVSPVDNGADVNTAEVIGGLTRSIERASNADVAYDTAIDHAVSGGFGFFRITTDYAHPESFELEARIRRIPNALMVHWDVNSTEADASDWNYAFVSDFLTEDQFKKRYPGASPVDFEGQESDLAQYWLQDKKVRLAEWWERTETKKKIVMLSDGSVHREDMLPKLAKHMLMAAGMDVSGIKPDEMVRIVMAGSGLTVVRERESTFHTVKRRVVSGVEVLETEDWPGSMIPICPVWGDEVYFDGRRHFRSMIRNARDAQAMHNFWRSATTELVALAPRAPFLLQEGSLPNDATEKAKWETANSRSHAYLLFGRNASVAPQRQPFAQIPAGALQEAITANEDMQAITGIYPASIGARSNETSGRAILARERQADVSNYHFIDNLSRAIRYGAQCLVELIPHLYSERESIRILGDDMKEKVIRLTQDNGPPQFGPDGKPLLYNLSVGKYDVTVSSGPSFATQRQEARETLIEIMRQVPDAAPVLGDVLLENMDFPGAEKVAKRLKALLPPAVQAAENGQPAPQQQVDPLESEEKKASIEQKRAAAILNLAKAGQTQVNTQHQMYEGVLNALGSVAPEQNPGVPMNGLPGQPAQPPMGGP